MTPPRPEVLWWGRHDPAYSRNAIVRQCFAALGWTVRDFRPLVSRTADLEVRLRGGAHPALVWVPCFRQRDLAAAARHARRVGVPLVADPLISAYDKQVAERGKFAPQGRRAARLLAWERGLLARADRVVADTHGHADYFAATLGVARERLAVVPVGADEALFHPAPLPGADEHVEALFYGSFLALQGPEVIVDAAARLRDARVRVTLLGAGPLHARCVAAARGNPRVRFEPWTEYRLLAARIHLAHVLLGVFGTTAKAGRVIPNKVYQSLACGRVVVTRAADAYPPALAADPGPGLVFVPPGDPGALAQAVDALCAQPGRIAAGAAGASAVYREWFGAARVRRALAALLDSLGLPARPQDAPPGGDEHA